MRFSCKCESEYTRSSLLYTGVAGRAFKITLTELLGGASPAAPKPAHAVVRAIAKERGIVT